MKKVLSLVLILVIAMSVVFTVSAADGMSAGTAVDLGTNITLPDLDSAFDALAEFLKLEAIMVYVNNFHTTFGSFYDQLNVWLQAIGVVIHGVLGGVFAG